jgi:site-specific DNA recombinase
VVRLIFDLYTRHRLGARNIATALNERGHRTTTGGRWSAHQILRVLANRAYLGELAFRGITCADCHNPIIEPAVFEEAQRILTARGNDHAKRAASGSDYLLTGLIRCPSCGSAMLGTRAHGKTRIYRYYSCYRRTRYDTTTCGAQRIDADAISTRSPTRSSASTGTSTRSSPTRSPPRRPATPPPRKARAASWPRPNIS